MAWCLIKHRNNFIFAYLPPNTCVHLMQSSRLERVEFHFCLFYVRVVLYRNKGSFTYTLPPKIQVRHVTGSYTNLFPSHFGLRFSSDRRNISIVKLHAEKIEYTGKKCTPEAFETPSTNLASKKNKLKNAFEMHCSLRHLSPGECQFFMKIFTVLSLN